MASFELRAPETFTTGTVGPPGRRTFYLQASQGSEIVTLKVEKQQVDALANHLERVLADLPPVELQRHPDVAFRESAAPAWVVGPLGIAYDEQDDRIVLVAEELIDESIEPREPGEAEIEPASARFHLDRGQVASFVERAREVIAGGRPACQLCGLPIDPDGHICPRNN
jgi:uncharacterized repeat protein (TIGR03847 family)